jgi:CubicO group peptidase (beta-lactamase class C family)
VNSLFAAELKLQNALFQYFNRSVYLMNSNRRCLLATFVVLTGFFIFGTAQAQISLNSLLNPYLTRYDLPAIAAAVVKDGKVISAGAVDTRRAGVKIPVTINDRFHLGSDTKAMTALLTAMLVEEGKLRWDTTTAEIFPELADKMDPGFRRVTLEQLLSHTSGIPSDNEDIGKVFGDAMTQPR